MSNDPIKAKILEFVAAQAAGRATVPTEGDVALLEGNLLDSLGILQLMMFLGDTFGIEVGDEDFVQDNFATVGTLADFVASKMRKAA
jgi:acyl carrier protein